jgi:hypothetical protein
VFPPQILGDTAAVSDNPDHALGQVDVQIVGHDLPLDIGCGAIEHSFQEGRKIGLTPMIADLAEHLSGRHVEPGDQGLSAVADILELPPFNRTRAQGQARRTAFQSLNAGHLIERDGAHAGHRPRSGGMVDGADVGALDVKGRIRGGRQPGAHAMGLEVSLLLKNARPSRGRWFRPSLASPLRGPKRSGSSA